MKYNQVFELGNVKVIPNQYIIEFSDQNSVKLQGKSIHVLAHLAANHTKVVSREELIDEVWNGNVYVGEKALTNAIWQLRNTFKTNGESSQVVETIRGIGYRLVDSPIFIEEIVPERIVKSSAPTLSRIKLMVAAMLIVAVLAGMLGINYFKSSAKQTFYAPELVTRAPGTESYVAPSPDGSQLVYRQRASNRNTYLVLKDLDSNDEIILTDDSAREGIIRWAPDGKTIYFSKKQGSDNCAIVSFNIATRLSKYLADCIPGNDFVYMDVSSDGSTLAFQGPQNEFSDSGIYFLDLNEPASVPVRWSCFSECKYRDRDIAFSPDGIHLAVTKRQSLLSEDVFLVNMQTNEQTQLTYGVQDISGLDWHPDGQRLVYATRQAGVRQGFIVNTKTLETVKLPIEGIRFPAFSHADATLYFESRVAFQGISKIAFGKPFPTFNEPLVSSMFSYKTPDYASTNDQIAYVSNTSGHYELWVMNSDGTNHQQLTDFKKKVSYPKWSHKQDKIVFVLSEPELGNNSIHIYEMANGQIKEVPSQFDDHGRPRWHLDDQSILSAISQGNNTDIYELDIERDQQTRLTFDRGYLAEMSAQGELIYSRSGRGLWRKSLYGEEAATEILNRTELNSRYAWSLDGEHVYYQQSKSSHYAIKQYDLATKNTSSLVTLAKSALSKNANISVNHNKQIIYFTSKGRTVGNIYRLNIE